MEFYKLDKLLVENFQKFKGRAHLIFARDKLHLW